MGDNSKFFAGLLLGAAAAVAVGYLLSTDKGKEFVADLKATASDVGDDLKDSFQKAENEVKKTFQKGKAFVDDLEQKANKFTS